MVLVVVMVVVVRRVMERIRRKGRDEHVYSLRCVASAFRHCTVRDEALSEGEAGHGLCEERTIPGIFAFAALKSANLLDERRLELHFESRVIREAKKKQCCNFSIACACISFLVCVGLRVSDRCRLNRTREARFQPHMH